MGEREGTRTIFEVRVTLPRRMGGGGGAHREAHRAGRSTRETREEPETTAAAAGQNLIAGWAGDQNLAIRDRSFLVIATGDSGFDVVRNCPVAVIKLRIHRARAVASVSRGGNARRRRRPARDMFVRDARQCCKCSRVYGIRCAGHRRGTDGS